MVDQAGYCQLLSARGCYLMTCSGNADFINCLAMKSVANKICVCLRLTDVLGPTFAMVLASLHSFSAVIHRCGMIQLCTSTTFCIVCTQQKVASSLDTPLRWFSHYFGKMVNGCWFILIDLITQLLKLKRCVVIAYFTLLTLVCFMSLITWL